MDNPPSWYTTILLVEIFIRSEVQDRADEGIRTLDDSTLDIQPARIHSRGSTGMVAGAWAPAGRRMNEATWTAIAFIIAMVALAVINSRVMLLAGNENGDLEIA